MYINLFDVYFLVNLSQSAVSPYSKDQRWPPQSPGLKISIDQVLTSVRPVTAYDAFA